VFAITLNGEVCGAIGIDRRAGDFVLGYWLGMPYWGRGFMSEAVAGVIDFAFTTLALPRLTSGHFAENDRSARILRKAGFATVALETKHCVARGTDVPHVSVVLNRDTWAGKSGIK
jgi:RimJ/RimL family protein N-acetyltransferase